MMINRGCERFEEIGALVAVGAARREEAQALTAHLEEGCAACAATQRDLQEIAARLAETAPPREPPPAVRSRLLDAIARELAVSPDPPVVERAGERRAAPRWTWPWTAGWALAAATVLILVWNIGARQRAAQRYRNELAALRLELAEKNETLRFLEARQTQTVSLKGLPASPNTSGRVFWDPQANRGLLFAFDLPLPPSGKVYQLWAIPEGERPVGAGIFAPDPRGVSSLKVTALAAPVRRVRVFAITVEPAGGSPQPTGAMYLMGTAESF